MYTFKGIVGNMLYRIFSILPIQNKIVFSSFDGKMYGDNPKIIFEEFQKRNIQYDYVWILCDEKIKIEGAKVVKSNSVKSVYESATAKVWIDNSRKREWVRKRKGQFYVQTWHGDVCLKVIEKDAERFLPQSYVRSAKNDSKMADLMLSGSKFRTENYKNAFWYNGEILECGCPKSDSLYQDELQIREKIRNVLRVPKDSFILLYVPTFRNGSNDGVVKLDFDVLLKKLAEHWSGNWVAVVRLHPNISNNKEQINYTDKILNGGDYPNTNELILASDFIITDYSGCMFDGLEAKKRVALYAYDLDEYVKKERDFYFDIYNLPFSLAKTQDELLNNIENFDDDLYLKKANNFREQLGFFNSLHSTSKVVDEILARVGWEHYEFDKKI